MGDVFTEDAVAAPRAFFTAPWDPVVVRRGDALGVGALTNVLAESVAPGLSNRVRDGRWVTVLSWCLVRSQQVFHASGGRSAITRIEQARRYAWLRPLELMWVARTIALAEDDWRNRPLAGRRSVKPWHDHYTPSNCADRFGMSVDQFQRYRQIGTYGGYRVAFRKWPEMTVAGDGWTPGPAAVRLAKWLDQRLGAACPASRLQAGTGDDDGISGRSAKTMRGDECRWWLAHWDNFERDGRRAEETLPRPRNEFDVLPEADLLEPLIFGKDPSGKRRRDVVVELANASAKDHIGLCKHLGRAFKADRAIEMLPRFSRLADAGMAAMEIVAKALGGESRVPLADVVSTAGAAKACDELYAAARDWLAAPGIELRHIETAHRFASAIPKARTEDRLVTLLQYHELYGGGQRWFVLRNGQVEPRMPPGRKVAGYGFRLWSLCRLATQCGVIDKMPVGLRDDDGAEDADE